MADTRPASRWREFDDLSGPVLRIAVPDQWGSECRVEVEWKLTPADASCWKRPVTISITPVPAPLTDTPNKPEDDPDWECAMYLSREDLRVLRDFFDLLLRSPDLRQGDDGEWLTKKDSADG